MHEDSGGPVPLAAHDNIFDDTDLADCAPNAEDAYATEIKESAHARTELIALVATNLTKHQSISEVLAAAATADALQAYDTTEAVKESARVLRAPKGDTNLGLVVIEEAVEKTTSGAVVKPAVKEEDFYRTPSPSTAPPTTGSGLSTSPRCRSSPS